jgi:hypothetical protein
MHLLGCAITYGLLRYVSWYVNNVAVTVSHITNMGLGRTRNRSHTLNIALQRKNRENLESRTCDIIKSHDGPLQVNMLGI